MDSKTLKQISSDAKTLQQLEDDIQQEIRESLNKSNLENILEKYGILKEKILTINYSIDISKMQSSDVIVDQQHQELLPESLGKNKRKLECWVVNGGCSNFP